ncbi:Hsp70 family protein, partial [candidate division KSB1 bacterium]|nr:Hsp70 family protein [candidate division KSB1 bacterium]
DQMVYQTEKNIKEMADKIDAGSKERLENGIKRINEVKTSERSEDIKAACEELNRIWSEVSSKLYERATAEGAQQQAPGSGPAKDKVEEADFEVVEDDSKR